MKKSILLLVVFVVVIASFVACKNEEPVASEPASSSEVASEEVSSEEVSEEVSEEPSEEISEGVSEEVTEEPSKEEMDLTPYSKDNGKNVLDLANDMNCDEVKMIVWEKDHAKEILSNGDSYKIGEEDILLLYYPQKMINVECSLQSNEFAMLGNLNDNLGQTMLKLTGEDIEVSFDATGEDGTTYKFTVFLTNN